MKIVVTGCSGFLGQYIANKLREYNYSIICLGNTQVNGCDFVKFDIRKKEQLELIQKKIKKADVFIHNAALIQGETEDLFETNVIGVYNVAKLAKLLGVKKIINISAAQINTKSKIRPITENDILDPQSFYLYTKLNSEKLFSMIFDKSIINLRVSSPVGIGMNKNTILYRFISDALTNKNINMYGLGTRIQDYINVNDIAEAVIKSLEISSNSTIFIASFEPISNYNLAKLVIKVLNSNSKIVFYGEDKFEDDNWVYSSKVSNQKIGKYQRTNLEKSILEIANNIRSRIWKY